MFCPNCQSSAVYGPETNSTRQALMRCADCSRRFDAIELYGAGPHPSARERRAA